MILIATQRQNYSTQRGQTLIYFLGFVDKLTLGFSVSAESLRTGEINQIQFGLRMRTIWKILSVAQGQDGMAPAASMIQVRAIYQHTFLTLLDQLKNIFGSLDYDRRSIQNPIVDYSQILTWLIWQQIVYIFIIYFKVIHSDLVLGTFPLDIGVHPFEELSNRSRYYAIELLNLFIYFRARMTYNFFDDRFRPQHGIRLARSRLTISKYCGVIALQERLDHTFGALFVHLILSTIVIQYGIKAICVVIFAYLYLIGLYSPILVVQVFITFQSQNYSDGIEVFLISF